MRKGRLIVKDKSAVYHVITRTVNGEVWFTDQEKEVLRKQLWRTAEFCGLEVLTYVIMSNHIHILLRVPERVDISDKELIRRLEVLYPHPSAMQKKKFDDLKVALAQNDEKAEVLRKRILVRMYSLSQFMKTLKQRFSVYYNRSHKRFGTLWAERFKSLLVEDEVSALRMVAAYIDLNPVRANICVDPKEYRFCGYAEAIGGNKVARRGLLSVFGENVWATCAKMYRVLLFGMGGHGKRGSASGINPEEIEKVMDAEGALSASALLRCRLRYLSDGVVLGSKEFVKGYFIKQKHLYKKRTRPYTALKDRSWDGLVAYHADES